MAGPFGLSPPVGDFRIQGNQGEAFSVSADGTVIDFFEQGKSLSASTWALANCLVNRPRMIAPERQNRTGFASKIGRSRTTRSSTVNRSSFLEESGP